MFQKYAKKRRSEPDKPVRPARMMTAHEQRQVAEFKRWQAQRGLTVKQAAELLGVAPITVFHWRSGINAIRPAIFKLIQQLDEAETQTPPPEGDGAGLS